MRPGLSARSLAIIETLQIQLESIIFKVNSLGMKKLIYVSSFLVVLISCDYK